ncbi:MULTISPECIES: UDP-galactopyranose mutase [Prochlorococcus]|uniref:UDP-galactopyranose mutase n=1 Tax=Prochlorococcus marinus (strain SARG / CCMP1375 / SS120) TaxID=167539 RepID=Q7VB14_PROMA|nr:MULTISPECIES: UDP-galactopyranose mutase [Prochlorococcus]AAQ00330.1 UDP-galactopyranose mutase [Prochlorococcus marinus subsp. marinus str. CCMP1375]KGG10186.1 UDP-galactopyranose mutase [Prochlorococcus marinus str. LG]KGG22220.1 UDP-galactopyranose mutase [Prochlorococcus marinus str. SS2]KGG24463.1 UDP-galactopyranose mutase [Prochlorococcus marinus str. SS35]KGG33358.1 UDP-galactopyranose mutase [Prochlorococcus marinus str. SS51]
MKKVLIIGGGFAGCAASHLINRDLKNYEVTLVEKSVYLGAGNKTQYYGGHPYTFGPRHFLTQDREVYEYLNALVPIRLCPEHEFITYVSSDSNFYNFPINEDDIPSMPDKENIYKELKSLNDVSSALNFEEYWIASVGKTLYGKFVNDYNKKMWLIDCNSEFDTFKWSPKGIALKKGPRAAWDVAISGYPYDKRGYDPYFEIATENTKVLLNTDIEVFDIPSKRVFFDGDWHSFDLIINTISPSVIFENVFGELPFIGRDLLKFVLPSEFVFPKNVYFIYFAGQEPFTRLVEYKKFTHHKSQHSLIGMEIPSLNGSHYPLPMKKWQAVADKYHKLQPDGVFSIGRAGSYRYEVDIDDCIRQAMDLVKAIS